MTGVIVVLTVIALKFSASQRPDFQEVLKQSANMIPQDNILMSNKKSQQEFTQKLQEFSDKLLEQQDDRMKKLEQDRYDLELKLVELKRPPTGSTLREQLAFLFPYDPEKKFPAYIWQTWKYGLNDDRFGDKFREGESAWVGKNPGFVHELFNDDTANAMVHHLYMHLPNVVRAYEILPTVALKMDFFRYLILLAKGGVYADVDTNPLQSVPNWIPENVSPSEIGLIVGIESDPESAEWKKEYHRRLQFGQWVLQAKPGHPILRDVVARITEQTLLKADQGKLWVDVNDRISLMQWTGTGIWTDVVFTYFNDYVQSGIFSKVTWRDFTHLQVPKLVSDVLVLPITGFSPGIGKMGAQDESHPLAFVKHYFEGIYKE